MRDALAIHSEQLAQHGGLPGLRDSGALESALARPQNLHAYGDPDLASLAAAYAFGLARNHPFADGNKRTSFAVCVTFLNLHGADLPTADADNIATWLALAEGRLGEDTLADWLRARLRPTGAGPSAPVAD